MICPFFYVKKMVFILLYRFIIHTNLKTKVKILFLCIFFDYNIHNFGIGVYSNSFSFSYIMY